MTIWGISWPSTKILSFYIKEPVQLAAIRFVFNTSSVFLLLKIFKVPLAINKAGYLPIVKGTLLIAIYNYLFFNGIALGKPGAGGILVTTITPIVTHALGVFISRKKLSVLDYIGLGLGVVAACFLLEVWHPSVKLQSSGSIYFLFCTVTWAFLSRVTATSKVYGHPLAFTFWIYAFCTLLLLVYSCSYYGVYAMLQAVNTNSVKFWGNMLFNAVINSGMATMFYFYATSQIGPERTSSFIYIVPFSAALSAYIIMGEVPTKFTIIGGILGLGAVALLNFSKIKSSLKK